MRGMKYGYARTSTEEQNPALQIAALKKAKCTHIFEDRLPGATIKRPALACCLKTLRAGDTLIVWKLDPLGRSLRDLITMLDDLRARGLKFHSFTEAIDTTPPTGRAMWQVIGVLAELERSLIGERTRAGVKAARTRGVKFGRKPKLTRQPRKQGDSPNAIADLLRVSRADPLLGLGEHPMALRVSKIKHLLHPDTDIDPAGKVDVAEIDRRIFACISSAQDALTSTVPLGFTDFERNQLKLVIEGQVHSHKAIRKLLQGEQAASAVDALPIARLQLETLYSFCIMLQDAQNVRLFLKNGWKQKYVRFLLQREERGHLPRFQQYFSQTALPFLETLQHLSSVTDAERRTIEHDELGVPLGSGLSRAVIQMFPIPMGVIKKTNNASQKRMLERLYPEYQYLCSFAHSSSESMLFRAVSDHRSPFQGVLPTAQVRDFYQRAVLEAPMMYSAIAAVQAATEVAAVYSANVELLAKVTQACSLLVDISLLAVPVWEIRAKNVLPLLGAAKPRPAG
jgi:DNA invertase Pin-like site-specific DNA recombinase